MFIILCFLAIKYSTAENQHAGSLTVWCCTFTNKRDSSDAQPHAGSEPAC